MHRFVHILVLLCFWAMGVYAQEQPTYQPYSKERLEQAVLQYEAIAHSNHWHTFPATLLLRPGDSSQFVPQLEENLLLTGDLSVDAATNATDYTLKITTAVQRFQARHGLSADGVVGPNTVSALNVSPDRRLEQLRINLTRFDSVFTEKQEPYAIINLPEFLLQVVDSGKTYLRMRVIVGKPGLKTYPIRSRLDMVVLNPYWYVPTSIAVNEIVPILRRNPGYLSKKNMVMETFTEQGWVRVNPWSVDWQSINRSNFNYRIVQLSGPENELGQVKFPFPNHLPQYLHDTPSKSLFNHANRAFSHGCIRLEKPVELAYYLLKRGSGYTTQRVDELWQAGKPNHYIRVKKPVPLHIVYFTSWVTEQMEVHFRDDVYGYDALLDMTLQQ
ncbi:L,D-transpeptidase family protein [Pontibacter anaerobius]|uniref:L,D-transpeptidase family protein n=1 Tax=Pontibacter anaerobius TaxID=2993940 RepID=A0ABT3RH30_9BACT|nr:L,D-transpeptidase family protein [Pontibacter anaerobius]MCX2741080.1 L,D-transpeptidase family protein [Pontibacter anaerobius]